MNYLLVITTFTDGEEAEKIANILLDKKASACVQIVNNVDSRYLWKGKVESAKELLCFIKTTKGKYSEVERIIKENHSYETPEIIAVKIEGGNEKYFAWIEENVK